MACGNKTKHTCGDTLYATCVDYEGALGNNSKITDDCITIEETTEDLYSLMDDVISNIGTDSLGNLCITYPLTEGKILPKTVFEEHEKKLCEIDTKLSDLNDLQNLDITSWGIDFGCLINTCSTPTQTLGDFIQNTANAICEGVVPPVYDEQPNIVSGSVSGSNLILTRDNSTTITIDVSPLLDDTNLSRIISGEVVGNDMVFTRNDSSTFEVDVTDLVNSPSLSTVVSGTVVGNDLILTKGDSSNITVDLSAFLDDTNIPRITSGSVSGNNLVLTRDDTSSININLSPFLDDTNLSRIESGSLSGNNLVLTRGDATTISVSLAPFLDDTNLSRLVSGSVSGSTITLVRDDSSSFDIDASSLSGGGGNDFITGANLSGTTLNLTGTGGAGASVSLAPLANTDSQTLSISGNNLSITGGNTVTLPSGGGSITVDVNPTDGSTNAVSSNGVYDALVGINNYAANNSISGTKMANFAITSAKLGTNSVITDKIQDSSITNEKLQTNSVQATNIANYNVTKIKIASDSIDVSKIDDSVTGAPTSGQILSYDGTNLDWVDPNSTNITAGTGISISGNGSDSTPYVINNTSSLTNTSGTGTLTLNGLSVTRSGTYEYVKIGRMVCLRFEFTNIDASSDTAMSITGFPFDADGEHPCSLFVSPGGGADSKNTTEWQGVLFASTMNLYVRQLGQLPMQTITETFSATGFIKGTITYIQSIIV